MKIDNKGFTLVELLAVITILLALSIVVVTNVSASLKRSEEQEKEAQEKIAINAAKIYFSMESGTCVTLNTLVEKGLVDASEIDKLNLEYVIRIGVRKYIYYNKC